MQSGIEKKNMGFLPSPLLSQQLSQEDDSEYGTQSNSNPKHQLLLIHSDSSTTSSSSTYNNSSLYSQPSLPSVPSLTQPNPPSAAAHHRCIATFKGHTSYIFSITIAGKHLYSGSSEGEIRLWSRDNTNGIHNPIQNIESPGNGSVKSLVVSGGKVFSAHHDSKIRVWKIKNYDDTTTVNRNFECVATLPTLSDRFCRIFSAKNYVEVRRHRKSTWVHHVDAVSALAVSHDGSLLYSASWDRTFKVWQTSDFRCLESVLNAHDDAINAIVVSVDGLVYTGSADKKIKTWRFKKEERHQLVATLEKHKSAINALALSTDGSILYSGACDRSIIVWEKDMNKGADDNHMSIAGALRGHTKAILCLSTVSVDLVFSGSADKTIHVWRRGLWRDYSCVAVMAGHGGPVKCLAACKDFSRSNDIDSGGGTNYVVYSGSLDCDIREWKIWLPVI